MVLRFQVLTWVKPGGLLYLTVPIGADVVAWNLHRRYGAPVAVVAAASPHSNPLHPPPFRVPLNEQVPFGCLCFSKAGTW